MTTANTPGESFHAAIERLRPVTLAELNADAELLTRTDRKYVVSARQLAALVEAFSNDCSVLDVESRRSFSYSTTYHDTDDRRLYLDTAHRRPTRFKVRVREYVDSGLAMLEVKTKNGRGRTVKHRLDLAGQVDAQHDPHGDLTPEMRRFVDSVVATTLTDALRPALRIDFRRTTLLDRVGDARCTIDLGLRSEDPHGRSLEPDVIVIETKSGRRTSSMDRWLWSQGVRPTRLSKYCTSMAALDAQLPANHWHRQLKAHFPPRRQPVRPLAS